MYRKAKVGGNQKILLQHGVDSDIWPAVCVCVCECVYTHYPDELLLLLFKDDKTRRIRDRRDVSRGEFRKTHTHIMIIIIYYTKSVHCTRTHTGVSYVCVLVQHVGRCIIIYVFHTPIQRYASIDRTIYNNSHP